MLRAKNAMLISICSIFFQMASISSLFEGKVSGPHARPLKVKVVATDEPVSYRGQDGTEKQALSVAVSDGNDCIKLVCYDPAKFPKLRLGNSIVLREVIRKGDEMPRYVAVSDGNDCIKLVCYDPAKFPKLRLGNSIVLREVIRKGDEMPRYVAVSDGNDCIKLVCYDPAKFPKLRLGNSIVLREVIRKGDEMPRYVVATRTNQIFLTGSINVPAAHTTEGIHILNPAPAEPVPVSQAL